MSEIHTEKSPPVRAYLAYYVGREMTGAWQFFPTVRAKLEANLGAVGVGREDITDPIGAIYETVIPGLDHRLPRHPDLNELNHLAALIEEMDRESRDAFTAVIEAGGPWDSMAEIINAAKNLDRFDFYPGAFSKEEFGGIMLEMHGEQYIEMLNRLHASDDPHDRAFAKYVERLETGADLAKYGELAQQAEGGSLTSVGYLLPNTEALLEKYSGPRDIPPEHIVTGGREAPEQKPSLLGAVAAIQEKQAADAQDEREAPSGPEL
jgi:hypothetical protein